MRKPWTPEELELLRRHLDKSVSFIHDHVLPHRSIDSIKFQRYRLKHPEQPKPADGPEQVEKEYWRKRAEKLEQELRQLREQNLIVERLIQKIGEMAPKSYDPHPVVDLPKKYEEGTHGQTALLLLSDTHIGKVTGASQTLELGRYNFDVFASRLKFLEDKIISIVTQHTTFPVDGLCVAMLGDMLDGTLLHDVECGQINPIFSQFFSGGHVVAQFLRNLAAYFKFVRVYDCVGNHARMPNQKRMPARNRFSNFDKFFYAYVRVLVQGIPNIHWDIDEQPFTRFSIYQWKFFGFHGDALIGGDRALGIPAHAIQRMVSTITQLFNKHQFEIPNYYLIGHLHRPMHLPLTLGQVIVNGAFPGVDEYGLQSMFAQPGPSQKFMFVHPVYGISSVYDIRLEFAPSRKAEDVYDLPKMFELQ